MAVTFQTPIRGCSGGVCNPSAALNDCDWDDSDCGQSGNEEEEDEAALLAKLQEQIRKDLAENARKNIGSNLLQYGPIHIIGAKQVEEDKLKLRMERKEIRRQKKLAKNAVWISATIPNEKTKVCQIADKDDHHGQSLFSSNNSKLCELVAKIAPPREWKSRGLKLRQYVSCKLALRRDAISLKEKMEKELKKYPSVTEDGMCKDRRKIMDHLFNELIRQCMVNCVERGKLLLKFRNEMHHQFDLYEKMFYSLIAHQINKIMCKKRDVDVLKRDIQQVKQEIGVLEEIKQEFQPVYDFFEAKFEKQQEEDEALFLKENQRLSKINEALKKILLQVVQEKQEKPAD